MKNPIFRGVHEKPLYRGDCLKEGRWTVFKFKRGLGEKEGGGVMSKYILPSSVWKFLGIRDV